MNERNNWPETPLPQKPQCSFGEWIETLRQMKNLSQQEFADICGLTRQTYQAAVNENKWTVETLEAICKTTNIQNGSVEAINEAGFWPPITPGKGRKRSSRTDSRHLFDALSQMEKAKPEARQEALCNALAKITPEKGAFLAVISSAVMPSPFLNDAKSASLREALHSAHDRDMMALFIIPSEEKVQQLGRMFGKAFPSSQAYKEGFRIYRSRYVDRLRRSDHSISMEEAARETDSRMCCIEYDHFDATQWRYIMCLIGECPSYNHVDMRVFERGPATRGTPTIVPIDNENEAGIREYVRIALVLCHTLIVG